MCGLDLPMCDKMWLKCSLLLCALASASAFSLGSQDVVFHIFTQLNPQQSQPVWPTWTSIMTSTVLSPNRPTVITIHDHGENVQGNFNAFVVNAFLSNADVNVIAVDWSVGSALYSVGLGNAPQVGGVVAEFINILVGQFGFNINTFRIVGVGLGAHIAGIAGRRVNGFLPYIIALNPSLHGWAHHPDILTPNDADMVEVLHTTAGITGYDYPLGLLDFYPNGGTYQAGCGVDTNCGQTYAYAFLAESINAEVNGGNQFMGTHCNSYEEAIARDCSGSRPSEHFGGLDPIFKLGASGIYTFTTNPTSPFARG